MEGNEIDLFSKAPDIIPLSLLKTKSNKTQAKQGIYCNLRAHSSEY